jgi:hypothetical protein
MIINQINDRFKIILEGKNNVSRTERKKYKL